MGAPTLENIVRQRRRDRLLFQNGLTRDSRWFGEHAHDPIIYGRHLRANRAAMFEPDQEIAQLEKNLIEINLLVSRQMARIERLAEKRGDTTQAKAVLRGLQEVLEYFRAQQRMILDTLEQG
jgi:hypothetical protein